MHFNTIVYPYEPRDYTMPYGIYMILDVIHWCFLKLFPIGCIGLIYTYDMAQAINPLPTNDAPMRHDLCELSISLWEFICGV